MAAPFSGENSTSVCAASCQPLTDESWPGTTLGARDVPRVEPAHLGVEKPEELGLARRLGRRGDSIPGASTLFGVCRSYKRRPRLTT
jgi:hypothetical protein